MNNVVIDVDIKVENLIYEIRGIQVMLDNEISATKCHKRLEQEMEMIKDE